MNLGSLILISLHLLDHLTSMHCKSTLTFTLFTIFFCVSLSFFLFYLSYLFLGTGKLQHSALLLDVVVLDLNLMCQLQPLLQGLGGSPACVHVLLCLLQRSKYLRRVASSSKQLEILNSEFEHN